MLRLAPIPIVLSLFFPSSPVLALSARTVYSAAAQGINGSGINLEVWAGYGLTINFIPTGEVIKQAWLGDPSRIAFTSNGNLCPQVGSQATGCTNTGATVIFLRQIKPLNFPNLTSSTDGGTQLVLITQGAFGQKQYQFKIIPASGSPKYTTLMIKPDSLKPTPVLPLVPAKQTPAGPVPVIDRVPTTTSSTGQQQRILRQNRPSVQRPLQNKRQTRPSVPTDKYAYSAQTQAEPLQKKHSEQPLAVPPAPHPAPPTAPRQQNVSSSAVGFSSKTPERPSVIKLRRTEIATNNSSSTKHSVQQAINDANAVAFGLTVARSRCEIKPRTTMWLKAQSAISLLRRGHTREEAARRSGVPLETLAQLIKWGQQRP